MQNDSNGDVRVCDILILSQFSYVESPILFFIHSLPEKGNFTPLNLKPKGFQCGFCNNDINAGNQSRGDCIKSPSLLHV